MAEMQRKREKEKKKTRSADILGEILNDVTKGKSEVKSSDLHKIHVEAQHAAKSSSNQMGKITSTPSQTHLASSTKVKPITTTKLEAGKVDPRVKSILPAWVSKPWRWMVPDDPQLKEQWLLTWGEFIVDFARVLNFHILDIQEIGLVYPFQNPMINKKLTQPQLIQISDYLVEVEKAKWWDDEKTRLRVYWKTLKSFSDELYEYAFQNGYDMVTAFDIVKMKQSWSTLPPPDIKMIMKLMVESQRASWADSERKTIQFIYY
ncbi:MAG: hypothetical protein ACW97X_03600 [Candidatus Hodarchaeales archaeon]|jgi:hypothetical protein